MQVASAGQAEGSLAALRGDGACSGGADLSSLLTLVVTTSPLPSMPSIALLAALLRSLALTPDLGTCHRILVADGIGTVLDASPVEQAPPTGKCGASNYKKSRVSAHEAGLYQQYIANIREAIDNAGREHDGHAEDRMWRGIELLALQEWHGFGQAVLAATRRVRTPYLLVVQHDQLLLERFHALPHVLAAMQAHPELLRYVGLPSRTTTVGYAERMQQRYGIALERLPLPELPGLPLLPLLMWYDKPHIVARQYLLDFVYCPEASGVAIRTGEFTEDVLGHHQLADIKQHGMAAHAKYGTWVLDAQRPLVYHLSGRKVAAAASGGGGQHGTRDRSGNTAEGADWESLANSSGAASFYVNVAGLASPPASGDPAQPAQHPPGYRFRGLCFHCNQKGHSFRFCPQREDSPAVVSVAPVTATEVCQQGKSGPG
eukprot:jgi/Tetstr1/436581/TSEL_025378.t1